MLFLLFVALVFTSRIQKYVMPDSREIYYAVLGDRDVELTIQLSQHTDLSFYYRITEPGEKEKKKIPEEELGEYFSEKYTKPGTYKIEVYNAGSEAAHISVYTNVMKSEDVDHDSAAIREIFSDIRAKLMSLGHTNMRLKTFQERNIMEARRIKRGLFFILVVPLLYIVIGFVKLYGIKTMFAPKKGHGF